MKQLKEYDRQIKNQSFNRALYFLGYIRTVNFMTHAVYKEKADLFCFPTPVFLSPQLQSNVVI